MSINRVKTTEGEQSFNFLTNQSSILHTVDTNKITINGVNVIVDKPKRGDIMCITKDQKVVWIDGLSIEPTQLSKEFEPVGICLVVKDNKALVRYREEKEFRWSAGERLELFTSSDMNDGAEHTCTIRINGIKNPNPFVFTASSRAEFVEQLNAWFLANDTNYSAELVELHTDLPAIDTSDTKDGNSYRNRIIINARFISNAPNFTLNINGYRIIRAIAGHIDHCGWYYKYNGFKADDSGGCCRAKFYEYCVTNGLNPTRAMTSIDSDFNSSLPVSLTAFTSNTNCQLLHDNFATYDEYLESMMVKFPCGAGGTITEFPCGKENTYKLANCTFLDNAKVKQEVLYPAANWAASIDLNVPKLGKGNWWLPSTAEMVEIMRDITYDTSFWETNPDIVNRVLAKLTPIDNSGWSMLSSSVCRWTSSLSLLGSGTVFSYATTGVMLENSSYYNITVSPITIYEF